MLTTCPVAPMLSYMLRFKTTVALVLGINRLAITPSAAAPLVLPGFISLQNELIGTLSVSLPMVTPWLKRPNRL